MRNPKQIEQKKKKTIFVATGTSPYDKLLQAIDNPAIYEIFIKHQYEHIIFQCPHNQYFKPLFHKAFEDQISFEVFGTEFPPNKYLSKMDLAITSCDVGVLLESHPVKINLIVFIEDLDSISYEIFTNLKEKGNVLGIKGADKFTSEFLDQYLVIKKDISDFLKGGEKIPGDDFRPSLLNEKSQKQLISYKDNLQTLNTKFQSQVSKLAVKDEILKQSMNLHLDYLNFAFDSNKLNLNLMRHPQFQHLEPLLRNRDFVQLKSQFENTNEQEEIIQDVPTKKFKADSQEVSHQILIPEMDHTMPKSDENEEDYFQRIRKNFNPYFYFENQSLFQQEPLSTKDEEFKENDKQNNISQQKQNSTRSIKYKDGIGSNPVVFNLDYNSLDPIKMLKSQDPARAQELHMKRIEMKNNELDELMSSIEKKEVFQMIKDEYEMKVIKCGYRICNCNYCKLLLVPFLVRKDFDECHQDICDLVLLKHRQYFDKVKKKFKLEDTTLETGIINNIFFREYKTNYISLTVESTQNITHSTNFSGLSPFQQQQHQMNQDFEDVEEEEEEEEV